MQQPTAISKVDWTTRLVQTQQLPIRMPPSWQDAALGQSCHYSLPRSGREVASARLITAAEPRAVPEDATDGMTERPAMADGHDGSVPLQRRAGSRRSPGVAIPTRRAAGSQMLDRQHQALAP